ncbi:MAG: hypothetical protein ACRDTF_03455 [Pseudonocardiaceae bacterium]
MLGAGDHAEPPESGPDACHPLDALVPDPTGMAPLCDEEEFAALAQNLVAAEAPRLFAVLQEYGERVDGQIAAWGMAFEDHAEVLSIDHRRRMSLAAPHDALHHFVWSSDIRARLVWFNPDAATPADDDEAA